VPISFSLWSGEPQTENTSTTCPFGRTAICTPLTPAGARRASTEKGSDHVAPPSIERRVSIVLLAKFMYDR
jgi:hypothetical protein